MTDLESMEIQLIRTDVVIILNMLKEIRDELRRERELRKDDGK